MPTNRRTVEVRLIENLQVIPTTQAKLVVLKDTGLYRRHLQVNANRDEFYLIDELQGNQLSRGELFYDQRTKEQAVPAKLQNGNWSPKATRQRQQFRLLIFQVDYNNLN